MAFSRTITSPSPKSESKKPKTAQRSLFYVNEIFYSIQGEGYYSGQAACFVRFAGCNLRCEMKSGPLSPGGFDCDTEFESSRTMTDVEILERIDNLCGYDSMVVFTGGEPLRQLTAALVDATRRFCAVETNGSLPLPDGCEALWVTCSPKVAEHAIKLQRANELKYVRAYGQGIPRPTLVTAHQYISPACGADGYEHETVRWCVDLVKDNPSWKLTTQMHKLWGVR
jgi:organic radical activating enzyme